MFGEMTIGDSKSTAFRNVAYRFGKVSLGLGVLLTSMDCARSVVVRSCTSSKRNSWIRSRLDAATYNKGFRATTRVTSLAQEIQRDEKLGKNGTDRFAERYSRQILFRGIGEEGQRKLAASHVALVGCGATGSALAGLLARAGVGTLRIIDRDYVEPSNLQRQSLFDESDAAESLPKAIAAARKISSFNSQVIVEPKVEDLTPSNIQVLLEGAGLILDGTDNFETRYLINDYSISRSVPWTTPPLLEVTPSL